MFSQIAFSTRKGIFQTTLKYSQGSRARSTQTGPSLDSVLKYYRYRPRVSQGDWCHRRRALSVVHHDNIRHVNYQTINSIQKEDRYLVNKPSLENTLHCQTCNLLQPNDPTRYINEGDCDHYQLGNFVHRNLNRGSSVWGKPIAKDWQVLGQRAVHTSSRLQKEESKVEKTVKALKDEVKQTVAAPVETLAEEKPKDVVVAKKSLSQRVVAEVKHYYSGFKLLFIDVRVCARYMWHVLNGKSLSRRERRQLVRTTADLFRLVPFLVFIVVPFMEFLLPVALKLFPNMLPSTFKEQTKEQQKLLKKLKVKLEMAKFLQDTIEESAVQRKDAKGQSMQDFAEFMTKIRTTGEQTSNDAIMKYSKLFEDEITLDNLQYGQLRALCKLLELPVVGTSNFLRFQLRMNLRQLETDDRMIQKEGVDSLAVWELQEACRSRGMRSIGVPSTRLRDQLQQWLDLHLNENIPTSLLLLSRALYLSEELTPPEQLKATISALPESTTEEAKVMASEVSADRVDNKSKLVIIKQEEQAIKEEREEISKLQAEEEAAKLKEEEVKKEIEAMEQAAVLPDSTPSVVDSAVDIQTKPEEILVDKAVPIETKPKEEEIEEEKITAKDLEEIEDVIESVVDEKMELKLEHKELEILKEDVTEYEENLEDLKEVVVATGGRKEDIKVSKAVQNLSKKVNSLIGQVDSIMPRLVEQKEALQEDIEIKEVKVKRSQELREDQDHRQKVLDQIDAEKQNLISINELLLAMRRLQKVSDDTKVQRIAEVLDEDRDGKIDVDDALKVIELLGRDNVKLSTTQVTEIMSLIHKENQIDAEKKQEKLKKKKVPTATLR